jgi:hypothetical protein
MPGWPQSPHRPPSQCGRPWFAPSIYSLSWLLALALIGATFEILPSHAVYVVAIV